MPIFGGIEPPNIEQTTPLNQDVLSAITLDKGVKSGQRYLGIDKKHPFYPYFTLLLPCS
jgi:hypothetical protein